MMRSPRERSSGVNPDSELDGPETLSDVTSGSGEPRPLGQTSTTGKVPTLGNRSTLDLVVRLLGGAALRTFVVPQREFENRRVRPDQLLFSAGDPLEDLFLVRFGSFRSVLFAPNGRSQVIAFPMRGDLIGLDALQIHYHPTSVSSLEDSYVTVLPHRELFELTLSCPGLARAIDAALSTVLALNIDAMRVIGTLGAEGRVARFLQRYRQRSAYFGYAPREFTLAMGRADIASYLGLSIETVSRAFTSLTNRGIIKVCRRRVSVIDPIRLDEAQNLEPHCLQPPADRNSVDRVRTHSAH